MAGPFDERAAILASRANQKSLIELSALSAISGEAAVQRPRYDTGGILIELVTIVKQCAQNSQKDQCGWLI